MKMNLSHPWHSFSQGQTGWTGHITTNIMDIEQDHSRNLDNLIIPLKMTISQKTGRGGPTNFYTNCFSKEVERGGGGLRPSHNRIFMMISIKLDCSFWGHLPIDATRHAAGLKAGKAEGEIFSKWSDRHRCYYLRIWTSQGWICNLNFSIFS